MNKKIIATLLISISIFATSCGNKDEDKSSTQPKNITQLETQKSNSESNVTSTSSNTETYYGQWEIKKLLTYGTAGTYSENDVKNILGKELFFSKSEASSFGDSINYLGELYQNPEYKKSILSQADFEAQTKVTFSKLGVTGNQITEVSVSSKGEIVCNFYIKDKDTLILIGGGTYFELKRAPEKK